MCVQYWPCLPASTSSVDRERTQDAAICLLLIDTPNKPDQAQLPLARQWKIACMLGARSARTRDSLGNIGGKNRQSGRTRVVAVRAAKKGLERGDGDGVWAAWQRKAVRAYLRLTRTTYAYGRRAALVDRARMLPVNVAASLRDKVKQEYGEGNYKYAIQLFSQAKATLPQAGFLEFKRQLLSNRAQSYLRWGDIYNALCDTETALSQTYTLPNSDISLTAKCLFRHAKLLYEFARYEEGRSEHKKCQALWSKIGNSLTEDEQWISEDIEKALKVPPGSKMHQKADLMRALDVGLFLHRSRAIG
ncbi:hypothetical protein EVG20_g10091 [Dentipellis fragilis]|uniref:Uncharacterized protein n=1 Tax=Dentipellis fragilis TaxID=205917 RepID=A0A4Y9XVN7_9AGAM|nr:hypothetical protein EVG20_g10091 [Dentipellis fragilis]